MSSTEIASPKQLFSFAEVMHRLGMKSRTSVYKLVARGELKAVKLAGSTKITGPSIDRFVASLPPAQIRPAKELIHAARPAKGRRQPARASSATAA